MKNFNQIIRIAIGLAVISIILGYIYFDCPITFKNNLDIGNVVTLLLNFGVIAILIQRFATQFLLKDSYYQFMAASKMKGYGTFIPTGTKMNAKKKVMSDDEETEESKKEFKQQLFWISWGTGMVIAAIGFRFFNNVIDPPSACTAWMHAEISVILDIFMTGILLSGGSALIMQIIMWWKSDVK
jgi:hypothetical protein